MSTKKKILKYANKPIHFKGSLKKQPIIISDSKGKYLKKDALDIPKSINCFIEFQCRGGARFADYYCWLKRNLQQKVNQYGHIVLYIFLGTCDLTKIVSPPENKHRKYIELRHQDDSTAVKYLTDQIDKYFYLVSSFPTVSIVFLEIPPYCIRQWNSFQGHPHPEKFAAQDKILYERISIINEYIKAVNNISHVESPKFGLDVKRGRKEANSDRRYSLCFAGYKDGIHTRPELARCWMRRLILQIIVDCA